MRQQLLIYALLVVAFALILLVAHPRMQGFRSRWGPPLVAWLNPPPEVDQLAVDFANTIRRERLRADLRRLERLLATDMYMSATRQLGNRLAYDWLVREFERVTVDLPPAMLMTTVDPNGSLYEAPNPSRNIMGAAPVSHAPKVEILEIGWRR